MESNYEDSLGFIDRIEGASYINNSEELCGSNNSSKLTINQDLTKCNYTIRSDRKIKYIVIHYTANNGDTAKGNADYFKNTYRGASAHYFVDDNSIYQCVLDKDVSWHCGTTGLYYHNECRNSNSIGIEMCSRKNSKGDYYFTDSVIDNCIYLVTDLMMKYNIDLNHIVRHYDVTHKICPAPLISDESWNDFKNKISNKLKNEVSSKGDNEMITIEELSKRISDLQKDIEQLKETNKILCQAIGWSGNYNEPALYRYIDSNVLTISKDAPEILTKLIKEGKLSLNKDGSFDPLTKQDIRLLIINNR